MKLETDERGHQQLRLSSGATLEPVMGVIGLSHDLTVHGGYDETIEHVDNEYAADWKRTPITHNDCIELADHMIQQWQKFREKHAAMIAAGAAE